MGSTKDVCRMTGKISVESIEEHEDGSATFTVQLEDDVREMLASEA